MKKYLVPLFLLLASSLTLAQQTGPITIEQLTAAANLPGDWSTQLWKDTLGPFFSAPFRQVGSPSTVLGRLFVVFNACVLAMSLAWLGWGILRGVVATAQDGEVLGKGINTAWYPIRVVVGLAGVLPALGGYTLAQGLLVTCASLGVGAANIGMNSIVKSDELVQLTGTAAISGAPGVPAPEVLKTILAMTRGHVCIEANQRIGQELQAIDPRGPGHLSYLSFGTQELESKDGLIIRYGRPGAPADCGEVAVRMEKYRSQDDSGFRSSAVDYHAIRDSVADRVRAQLRVADRLAQGLAFGYMAAVDSSKAGAELKIDYDSIQQAVQAYGSDLQSLIQQAVSNGGRSIKENAQAQMTAAGWMGAGSWHSVYAEANAALADAVAGVRYSRSPAVASPTVPGLPRSSIDEELQSFDALVAKAQAHAAGLTVRDQGDESARAVKEVQSVACGLGGFYNASAIGECSIGQAIVRRMIGAGAHGSGGGQSTRDDVGLVSPIVAMKNLGDYVMTIGSGLVGFQGAASVVDGATGGAASSALSGGGGLLATAVTKGVAGLVSVGWIVLLVGAVMSIYVPMIPWIVWISGIVAYCASVLEALISMPLHSMAHMHTEGEGMGQATSKGYLMMLQVFARPSVMLISFFAAGALSIALGTFVTKGFVQAMSSAQGDSVTGLASIMAYVVLYLIVTIVTTQGIFSLIVEIPDKVISYLGQGEVQTTVGRDGGDKTQHSFMGATRGTQSAGMSAAAGAMKPGSKK